MGSSLVVFPAATFPVIAKRKGARLVIVNREPTEFDDLADLVVRNLRVVDAAPQAGNVITLAWDDLNQGSVATNVGYTDRLIVRQRKLRPASSAVISCPSFSLA